MQALIQWRKEQHHINAQITDARHSLDDIQRRMTWDPSNVYLQIAKKEAKHALDLLLHAKENMIKQNSQDQSINLGDSNTRYQ